MCPGSLEFTPREGRVGRLITGIVSFGNWSIDRLFGEVRVSGLWSTSGSCSVLAFEVCGHTSGYGPILKSPCEFRLRSEVLLISWVHFSQVSASVWDSIIPD